MHSLVSGAADASRAVRALMVFVLIVWLIVFLASCAPIHRHESCDSTFAYTDYTNPGEPKPVYVCRPSSTSPSSSASAS